MHLTNFSLPKNNIIFKSILLLFAIIYHTMSFSQTVGTENIEALNLLAKNKNCFSCHSIDKKVVGPAFREVAARYREKEGSEAILYEKIRKGGSGKWGVVPMPANTQVNDAETKQIVNLILHLK